MAEQSAKLKVMKGKRAQIKAQCTRFRTYLTNLNVSETSLIELRQRHEKFIENWQNFNDIQSSIEETEADEDSQYEHHEERTQFETKYFAITVDLETLIEGKQEATRLATNLPADVSRNAQNTTNGAQGGSSTNDYLKLPRINLPVFSGKYDDWVPFKNIFTTMFHDHPTLPKVQKMQYLIAALKGEAHDIISSFETSEDNYDEA